MYDGEADFVSCSAVLGELGIMPRHAPLLSLLKPGVLRILKGQEEELIYISGGILEVQPDEVTVLSDTAIRGEDLDEERAQQAKQDAEEKIKDSVGMDYAAAQAELAQAVAQLQALRQFRRKR